MPLTGDYPSLRNSEPSDRSKREHVGTVSLIRWSDPDSGAIIAVLTDGRTVSGRSGAESIEEGLQYRFLGKWKDHPRYGPQFAFDTYAIRQPATRKAVVRYLVKLCDDIGERTAERLWVKFGSETISTLRENPAAAVTAGLLRDDVAAHTSETLRAESEFEATKLELFDLFAGRGFPADKLIKQAIEKWGAKAPQTIRRNPFALLVAELSGCGFKRTDKMWLDFGKKPTQLRRQMFAAWHAIHTDAAGDTWFPLHRVANTVRELVGMAVEVPERAILLGKRTGWFRTRRDETDHIWVAARQRAHNEQSVADVIARLRTHARPCWPGVDIAVGRLSEHQAAAVAAFATSPVGLLIGTPGTGKTFTAAALIRHIIAQYGVESVAVAAPTGKAAVRCTQALKANGIDIQATTIHRLLGLGTAFADKGETGMFNESNPLPQQFIIVDESSMLDTDLAGSLFRAMPDTANVLLIGDPYQLPPVGHGAPLRDLITASVPTGELTEIRRNAGLIVRACAAIKNGEPFTTAERYDPETGDNLRHFETADDAETIDALEELLLHFRANAGSTFHPIWQTQVLVAVNDKGNCSRKAINERLQLLLNPDGKACGTNPFHVGDKIICLKNGRYSKVRAPNENCGDPTHPGNYTSRRADIPPFKPEEQYVANGEIGRVVACDANVMIARMGESEACVKVVIGKHKGEAAAEGADEGSDDAESKGRGCNFDLAYAITTHKSQGSESPCVICVVDKAGGRVAGREFWYTALSRASRLCVTIGQRSVLDQQAKRVTLKSRKTFLRELVEASSRRAWCERPHEGGPENCKR